MKIDEMITKVGRKAKVDDATARRVIREVIANLKEELSVADVESRISVPTLGVFVVRPGKEEGGKNRIILNLSPPKTEKGAKPAVERAS